MISIPVASKKTVVLEKKDTLVDDNPNGVASLQEMKRLQEINYKHDQLLLKEREEKINQVESVILDVNYIMGELATLTYSQAPVVSK